jgi:hypothetical protein
VYDSAMVGTSCGSNCSVYIQHRPQGFHVTLDGVVASADEYAVSVSNNITFEGVPNSADVFSVQWRGPNPWGIEEPLIVEGSQHYEGFLYFAIIDVSGEVFNDTSLPTQLDLADFNQFTFNWLSDKLTGQVDVRYSVDYLEHFELLPGDFNYDSSIDMVDYELWQSSFASNNNHAGDANNDGVVDAADYTIWRDHGSLGLGSSGFFGTAVPEPATGLLVLPVLLAVALRQIYRRRG